jgi:hypothetical protein
VFWGVNVFLRKNVSSRIHVAVMVCTAPRTRPLSLIAPQLIEHRTASTAHFACAVRRYDAAYATARIGLLLSESSQFTRASGPHRAVAPLVRFAPTTSVIALLAWCSLVPQIAPVYILELASISHIDDASSDIVKLVVTLACNALVQLRNLLPPLPGTIAIGVSTFCRATCFPITHHLLKMV